MNNFNLFVGVHVDSLLAFVLVSIDETLQVIYQSKYVSLSILLLYCSNCLVTAILLLENILEVVFCTIAQLSKLCDCITLLVYSPGQRVNSHQCKLTRFSFRFSNPQ